jgi:hypothetical protein
MKSALAVIYNHRFDRNIPVIDRLYEKRFDHIRQIAPFYDGESQNVIPTYYGAYSFNGFFADYFDSVDLPEDITHVTFIGDDLLLNPSLNMSNIVQELDLGPNDGYIKELNSLTSYSTSWHSLSCIKALQNERNFQWKPHLPPIEEAIKRFEKYGYVDRAYRFWDVRPITRLKKRGFTIWNLYRLFGNYLDLLYKPNRHPAYPLFGGYSDFVVVPVSISRDFSRLCRVFAAARVFVEVALPSALALACEYVKCENEVSWSGLELWRVDQVEGLEERHRRNLTELLSGMNSDRLYIHPIKLSKWTYPIEP